MMEDDKQEQGTQELYKKEDNMQVELEPCKAEDSILDEGYKLGGSKLEGSKLVESNIQVYRQEQHSLALDSTWVCSKFFYIYRSDRDHHLLP